MAVFDLCKGKGKRLLSVVYTFWNPYFHNCEIIATVACNGLVKGNEAFHKSFAKVRGARMTLGAVGTGHCLCVKYCNQ